MTTFIDLLITAGRFLVGLWPLMFLAVLVGVFKRQKGFKVALRTSIKGLVVAWAFFALLNSVFFIFKLDTFHLLPEDVNSRYFLALGLILAPLEVAILLEERHKRLAATSIEDMRALSPSEFETEDPSISPIPIS